MVRFSLILVLAGLQATFCGIAQAEALLSPPVHLVLVPFGPPAQNEDAPYTKVFSRGAYFYFPDSSSPEGARLLWATPADLNDRSLYGRGDVIALTPRQQARAFELAKIFATEGVDSVDEFPFLVPYPKKPYDVMDAPLTSADSFRDRGAGDIAAGWAGVRVDLDRDGKPAKSSLLFQYRDHRTQPQPSFLPLDFDVKALPVRPFPTVDPSKPNECNFGLDLGDGLKAMRVLGYNKDGGTVFAAYEEHLRQARRKPGLVRIFNVPFELLRALPTGTDEQKRNQFERWARRATTEREMEILHALKSPILIPVQVPSNWDETAFHLYLLATTERSSRQFIGRYEVFAAIEGLKRRVRACRRAVILAGERLVGSFFRRPGN